MLLMVAGVTGLLPVNAQRVMFRARTPLLTGEELPPSVDNSKTKYFPPIIDQLGGSCAQAAAIGYMFTYEMNRLLDRDATASLDNRMSYQFAWNLLNEGEDQGGFAEQGLLLAKNFGIMNETDYGKHFYFKWASGYEKYVRAMRNRAKTIYTYEDSVPLMKRYLFDAGDGSPVGGILTFSGQATGWVFDSHYEGPSLTGYHSLLTSLATDGAHAMTIVGYDDTVSYTDSDGRRHDGAFIAINSWGSWWQDKGRFYLPYDFFRDPTVKDNQLSSWVMGVSVTTYDPKVIIRLTVDYSSRDDLSYAVAASRDRDSKAPASQHFISAFANKGGDLPMAGGVLGSQIEMAFDITRQAQANPEARKFFLNIFRSFAGRKKGEGRLVGLSAIDYRSGKPVEYLYRDTLPVALADGYNYFGIPLVPRFTVPASPLRYTKGDGRLQGKNLTDQTFLVRTADGRRAKVQFSTPDVQGQTISIRYKTTE